MVLCVSSVGRSYDCKGAECLFIRAKDAIERKDLPAMTKAAHHLLWSFKERQKGSRLCLKDVLHALYEVGGDGAVRPVLEKASALKIEVSAPFPTY